MYMSLTSQYGLGCLVKSFIRFLQIGLPVQVKYQVSVDWEVSGLCFLCTSLV